jgi:hypothetical protein
MESVSVNQSNQVHQNKCKWNVWLDENKEKFYYYDLINKKGYYKKPIDPDCSDAELKKRETLEYIRTITEKPKTQARINLLKRVYKDFYADTALQEALKKGGRRRFKHMRKSRKKCKT